MSLKEFCSGLEKEIEKSYTEGVSVIEAERLSSKFLHALIKISDGLKTSDLDARMRKSGVKGIKAAIYLDIVQKSEKKPTETQIASMVDTNDIVQGEQERLDTAEVEKADLERYYDIFTNAHIFYRGVAKGNFNG